MSDMDEQSKPTIEAAVAERAAWQRMKADLTAKLAIANSELEYWDSVVRDLEAE